MSGVAVDSTRHDDATVSRDQPLVVAGMGSVLQQRVDKDRRNKASWSNNGPNVVSNNMGKRVSQRKSPQIPATFFSHDCNHDNRPQQRRKHKSNTCSSKRSSCRHSAQGTLEPKSHLLLSPHKHRVEPKVEASAQIHTEQTHTSVGANRRKLSDSRPDLLGGLSLKLEANSLRESDGDTDMSESETRPVLPSVRAPPQLELRPEVIDAEGCTVQGHRSRGQACGHYDFPDFLPPPFNSWNLRQLAVFYSTEGRGAHRPRPVGSLERYLERLLQLEWHQLQTLQEESGKSAASDVTHRSAAAASSRLSSPKCILQCQRAFPLTFLSSLVSQSALLSGCACTLCCIRYFSCSTWCCHSSHSHVRPSRISPILERREPVSLPKRSYSESRVHSFERRSESQRFNSPVRTNNHLRRMQASGNIRNPVQGAIIKPQSTARDLKSWDSCCLETQGKMLACRRRSGSERRSIVETQHNGSQKQRSGSECRRRGMERRRIAESKEIKPDAVTAIMDNLPASRYSSANRPHRHKQVEFVT